MPPVRNLILFALFVLFVLFVLSLPAHAMSAEDLHHKFRGPSQVAPEHYVHLVFTAEKLVDQSLMGGLRIPNPLTVQINQTSFVVQVEYYFVPGNSTAATFLHAKFNVRRENHQWLWIDNGIQRADFMSGKDYELNQTALWQEAERLAKAGRLPKTYPKVLMPDNSVIARTLESPGGISHLLQQAEVLRRGNFPDQPVQLAEVEIGIPEGNFVEAQGSFPVQVRLRYDSANFKDRRKTIWHRKMIYGYGTIAPMTAESIAKVAQLQSLLACESQLQTPNTRKN